VVVAVVACAALAVAAPAGAQSGAEIRWDMPTPYADSNFRTQNVLAFVDEIAKATGGRLEITVHDNASLFPMPEIKGAIQSGQVNIGAFLLAAYGHEDPIYEADAIPFLAAGLDEAWRLYQIQKPYLEKRLEAQRLRLLYSVPGPGQGFYTRTPIARLSDLRGVKFRAVTPTTQRLAQLIGADPVAIRAVGVRQAFASGEVTAMLASPTLGIDTAAWEYARYFYPTNAAHPREAIVVNDRAFHRLPEDIQTAMLEVAARAELDGWRLARLNAVEIKRTFTEHGLKVVEPSAEMMREFRAVGRTMADDWVERVGPDGAAIAKALER